MSDFYQFVFRINMMKIFDNFFCISLSNRSMKSRILATYPDAFPDDSKGEVLDRRPDLEVPQ